MSVRIINNNNLFSQNSAHIICFIHLQESYWNLQIMHIYLHSVYCGFLDKHTSGIDVQGPVQAHVFASHYVSGHVIDSSGIGAMVECK